ncbi:uncharacterized protein EI90DRAFT_3016185 [Cantharellus anzutake]|uniref:uncharacterized protein n=1 Tax=Cantharellus anzutake TaxID=1750568 RepID=UPI0019038E61|nr:uncharacterized protein EI90DRAFT_3016185 [Cantharellus anzutake]KAF8332101.1 hypothetical protein EI90DRAFT_3016185 [Cantharellus anzutake]
MPLLAFFISTTVDIWSPVSSHYPNASGRLWAGSLQLIPAFSNLGYDHLVYANEIGDGSHSLAQVTTTSGKWGLHAKHFPLKMALDLLPFSQSKLLNAINVTELTKEQKLACLSQRLSLEFDSKSHWAKAQERTQVECHLRMCLQIDEDSGIMASVSPSEPLVAEAAALSMQKFNSVKAMQDIFNDFSLHHGNRGEPLAMLLLTLARDNADPPIVNILQLIHALFTQAESVLTMKPTISPEGLAPSFEDTFRNAGTHFNHFLQLHQRNLCSVERLLELMSRGAFVLHANGQPDFDLCGAGVLDDGQNISKTNSFVILVQAQNDPFWTHKLDLCLFDGMDSYKLGILHKDDAELNIPIIRVVFALGSVKAQLVPIGPRSMPRKGFTLYDIWCAGLSADIFCPVKQEDEGTWDDLLRTSRIWERLYKTSNKEAQILRRQLNPGAAAHEDHWNPFRALRLPAQQSPTPVLKFLMPRLLYFSFYLIFHSYFPQLPHIPRPTTTLRVPLLFFLHLTWPLPHFPRASATLTPLYKFALSLYESCSQVS